MEEASYDDCPDRGNIESFSGWEHRTIRHVNTKFPSEPAYFTVHEFYIETGEYIGYQNSPASPMSKKEAEWMSQAFDRDPVVEVDDATIETDSDGESIYKKMTWLNKKAV